MNFKKLGISLIIVGIVSLVFMIIGIHRFPVFFRIFLFILSGLGLPFGSSLIVWNSYRRLFYKQLYLYICLILITSSIILKFTNLPLAGITGIVGVVWFCFAYSPLRIRDKFLEWSYYSKTIWENILLSTLDYVGLSCLLLGMLFKRQHWPFADLLFQFGAFTTLIGLIIWNIRFKKEVRYRKKAEEIITNQINEIKDSIEYAKRIQTAILPPPRIVKEFFENSFILYLPKDIVAGDFYWMENIDNNIYFAACDCTGHGVPGAMVSVVCNTALNRSVNEFGERMPGKILDRTRELVLENFVKSDEEVKDGMDASLGMLDANNKKLYWAGANNPLWIYRNVRNVIEEIKADKQPIGKTDAPKPFTTQEIELNEGDIIYLFTDGYADQFGGTQNRKLTKAKFREQLLSIATKDMNEQRELLLQFHDKYKGKEKQIDDICVIGVRV